MEITVRGEAKEIAALVLAVQERRFVIKTKKLKSNRETDGSYLIPKIGFNIRGG